jgi:TonB family protein
MLALWMLGALLAALLAGASALAAERALRLWRGATRWVWAAALAGAALLPAAALLLPRLLPATRGGESAAAAVGPAVLPTVVVVAATGWLDGAAARLAPLDRPLAAGWALLSALALARLALGLLALRRARRGWRLAQVDATPVLVARDAGPLVIGVRQPSVVLPEWALALDGARRAMILRHEAEHARARDPALLLAAAVGVALAPWNLALRWHARRLRLAVEVDCDARVLRAHPDVRRYALLLVDVARRAAVGRTPLAAAALVEPPTDLERRIAAMHGSRTRHRVLLTLLLTGGAGAAALASFAACSVADPTSPRPPEPEKSVILDQLAAKRGVAVTIPDSRTAGAEVELRVRDGTTYRVRLDDAATREREAGSLHLDPRPAMEGDAAAHPEGVRPGSVRRDGAPPPPPPRPVTLQPGQPYFEFQVEKPVVPAPGNRGPRYPGILKPANVEGEVLAQFVVDEDGRVEIATFKVLKTSHALFSQAVLDALAEGRYVPAEIGGKKVKQLVQQPFQFHLSK